VLVIASHWPLAIDQTARSTEHENERQSQAQAARRNTNRKIEITPQDFFFCLDGTVCFFF
jgi:hypothetical protein